MSATVKVFLSYSTKDKDLATDIKEFFDELGINTFLAHQTIEASAEWRREIKKQLEKRQVFLALLTSNSHESDWVDQEIGMAIAFKKMIVPLPVQTPLYGFVADFQAVETRPASDFGKDFWRIVRGIVRRFPGTRSRIRARTLTALRRSRNFHKARDMIRILENVFSPLTRSEKVRIYRASTRNDQIDGFTETNNFVGNLKEEHERAKRR